MIHILPGTYVRVKQMEGENAPRPLPLSNGFDEDTAYLVIGASDYSETSESYFLIVNSQGQSWFISNRHLRVYKATSKLTIDIPPRR